MYIKTKTHNTFWLLKNFSLKWFFSYNTVPNYLALTQFTGKKVLDHYLKIVMRHLIEANCWKWEAAISQWWLLSLTLLSTATPKAWVAKQPLSPKRCTACADWLRLLWSKGQTLERAATVRRTCRGDSAVLTPWILAAFSLLLGWLC